MKTQVEIAITLDKGNNEDYEIKTIYDNTDYVSKLEGFLSGFYFLVL